MITPFSSSPDITPIDACAAGDLNWLYVDMNSYFASCEQHDRPELCGKPLMVVPVRSDYTCAIAASYEAKALGIKTGTKVIDAKRLCPDIIILDARPNRYVDIHHEIIKAIETVRPIEKVCSIDEVAIRLTGPDRHEPCAYALGRRIKLSIFNDVGLALACSVGIAPSRLLAKTAADMQKPNGLTLLRKDQLPGPLLDLKIDDFAGIGTAMTKRLHLAGISNVRTLWETSPTQLRRIWGGIGGDHFWYALHGIDPPEIDTQRSSISHSHVLARELRPLDEARKVARRLTAKCGSRLRRMGYRCVHLHMSLRGDPAGRVQTQMRLPMATNDTFRLLSALDVMWEECVKKLDASRIKKISINCARIVPIHEAQNDLFGGLDEENTGEDHRHMRLLSGMDALNQRYGKDMITIGPRPKISQFVGAKIAFTRIPEKSEFRE